MNPIAQIREMFTLVKLLALVVVASLAALATATPAEAQYRDGTYTGESGSGVEGVASSSRGKAGKPTVGAPRWQAGRYWRFDVRSKTTEGTSLERLTHTVLAAKRISGEEIYALVSTRQTRSGAPLGTHVWFVHARDFFVLDLGRDRRWYLVSRLWDFPLRPGKKYAYGREASGKKRLAKVEKVTSVRTNAGTFQAVSVRRRDSRGQLTTWFAPRVGFDVKVDSRGFSAELADTGRLGSVAASVFVDFNAILKASDQGAKLSLVPSLGRLARAGIEVNRAAGMLEQLANDADTAVKAAARGELDALAGKAPDRALAARSRTQAAAGDPATITIGTVLAIVNTVWKFAETVEALTKKKFSIDIKPKSRSVPFELGTTVTVPWEIDFAVGGSNVLDWLPGTSYRCSFKIYFDGGQEIARGKKECNKGLNQRFEEITAALLAARWECGRENQQKIFVEAAITRSYPVFTWVDTDDDFLFQLAGFEQEEELAAKAKSEIRFWVYNPFFLSHLSLDPSNHNHDVTSEMSVTVKAEKRLDFANPPNSDGWFFDKLSVGGHKWKYTGFVLGDWLAPDESRHHDTHRLDPKEPEVGKARVQWDLTSTHVGRAGDHERRHEAWRAVGGAYGTRNLGAQQGPNAVPVEWKGELLGGSLESGKCSTDLTADDD